MSNELKVEAVAPAEIKSTSSARGPGSVPACNTSSVVPVAAAIAQPQHISAKKSMQPQAVTIPAAQVVQNHPPQNGKGSSSRTQITLPPQAQHTSQSQQNASANASATATAKTSTNAQAHRTAPTIALQLRPHNPQAQVRAPAAQAPVPSITTTQQTKQIPAQSNASLAGNKRPASASFVTQSQSQMQSQPRVKVPAVSPAPAAPPAPPQSQRAQAIGQSHSQTHPARIQQPQQQQQAQANPSVVARAMQPQPQPRVQVGIGAGVVRPTSTQSPVVPVQGNGAPLRTAAAVGSNAHANVNVVRVPTEVGGGGGGIVHSITNETKSASLNNNIGNGSVNVNPVLNTTRTDGNGTTTAAPTASSPTEAGTAVATGPGGLELAPLNRDGKNLSEKKIRRLEKNRLSARNCRRKKKEYTQSLQREMNILEGENLRLRLQLQIGQEAEQSSLQEQERVTEGIDELLKSGASDAEIHNSIEVFKEKFADYGRDRRSAMEFHLRNVERLLMPTTTTSVAMRALQGGGGGGGGRRTNGTMAKENGIVDPIAVATSTSQSSTSSVSSSGSSTDISQPPEQAPTATAITATSTPATVAATNTQESSKAAVTKTDPKELFKYLVNFLQVTPEQASALKDSRHVARELDDALAKSLSMLKELKDRLTNMGQDLDAEFSEIRSILTPRQAAKFLVWVANNGACMHMLNELWSKVYPEPVVDSGTEEDGSE